ncbi:MAG: EamA family transporter [Rhodospirillaceae bacterium]|nr:EamA family transporter [Rhodospirillaceae bacterium]
MKSQPFPWQHALLAFAVATVWGSNFVVIKVALDQLPPLLFAALRFALALLPAVFFLKRPQVPWLHLAAYGLLIGVGQFGVIYYAMNGHISPGLTSVVIQTQVVFTILLSMWLERERVQPFQWAALILAVAGIGVIAVYVDQTTTSAGLAMVLFAALCWAGGNLVSKRSGRVNALAYVVWASLFSAPPLFVLSLVVEGWPAITDGLMHADVYAWASVAWQSFGNTLFGYVMWGWLLARHPTATVAPWALLVPVVGLATAVAFLDEPLPLWKIAAAALIVGGLAINLLWPQVARRYRPT